jgi:heat shock protein HslJ
VGWLCAGYEETPFTTAFYRNTESPAAVITFGDDQVVAPIARSGSGSRYATADVEFWEHQGDASVSWFGTAFTCRPAVTSASQLSESSWTLARFQPTEGPPLIPGPGRRFTLAFGPEGRLQVQADCNRGTGTWQSSGGAALTLGPVALTRSMCQPSPVGDRFVRDLDDVRSFALSEGRLVLELAEGGGTYEFEPNVAGRQQ